MDPTTIGVRELKNEAPRIVREVRETQAEYIVTVRGEPAVIIRPFTAEDAERLRLANVGRHLDALEALAERIGDTWTSPKSGVDLIDEQRRG